MANQIGISVLGCGAVGAEVVRQLHASRRDLAERTGLDVDIRQVLVRAPGKPRKGLPASIRLTSEPREVLADPDTRIVVELIGGLEPARTLMLEALASGRDVVTANKALLAMRGAEVFASARRAGRVVAFEAAVCGGVPVVQCLRRGMAANRIDRLVGIVNGTCNFILTRMLEAGSSYAHALGQAQRLGFAEADPALDVQGIDSAHKLVILASLALRQACRVEQVEVRGITDVELTDLCAGRELGYACKLLASARRREGGIELTVCPTFVPLSHPLASVGGPVNAVSLYGDRSGPVFLSGLGAGGRATASAVVSDILDVACGNAARTFETWRDLPDQTSAASAAPRGESVSPHYIRFNLLDRPGAIGRVAAALGDAGLSIATIVQHEPPQEGGLRTVPVVVTTHPAARARLGEALSRLANWEGSVGAPVSIPVFTE